MAALLALAACDVADPARDRDLYEQALRAGPDEGPELCARIADLDLRDECYAYDAGEAAAIDLAEGERRCEAVSSKSWRGECFFLVADRAGAIGGAAVRLCKRVRGHQRECIQHALDRDIRGRTDLPLAVGDEVALLAMLDDIVADYAGFFEDPSRSPRTGEGVLGVIVADRWSDRPFDPSLCGVATEEQCIVAFRMGILLTVGDRELDALCVPEAVEARRATAGWTEAGADLAAKGWESLCGPRRTNTLRLVPIPLRTPPDWDGHVQRHAPGRELYLRSSAP